MHDTSHQSADKEAPIYLTAAQVRARYGGMSDMGLWRWLHNGELGFPKPFRINRRRFWKASELTAWDSTRRASNREAA
jgi:predicted DNA-binding transcriptional regulator AlpA